MTREQEFELVTRAARSLQKAQEAVRTWDIHMAEAQQAIAALLAFHRPSGPVPAAGQYVRIAIVNGHRLTGDEVQALDEDVYDVILDTTNSTLRHRGDPENHSQLRLSDTHGIGPYRIKILAFMIERFGVAVCSDNVDDLLGEVNRIATAQAFTKSISVLRQALGGRGRHNPYIQSAAAWELSRRTNAQAYSLNPEWNYLLVRYEQL